MVVTVLSGVYLILWTESHLEDAFNSCENAIVNGSKEDDPMLAWAWGSCFKGKRYPLFAMEDYISTSGEKLYCDCKYAMIAEYNSIESAVGFINRMRSLCWIFWISQFQGSNTTLITNPNLQLILIKFHYPYREKKLFTMNIDLSASINIETIHFDFQNVWDDADVNEDPIIITGALPALLVFYCSTCYLVDFDPCESPLLRNLWLDYSSMPQLNLCFADLRYMEALIVKNTWLSSNTGVEHLDNHCRGRCLQSLPALPKSLVFLILDQQNISEVADWDALADIEMVSLWGNPVCGIHNLWGEWRNYTGKDQYCMKTGSEGCVVQLQEMIKNCDDTHAADTEDWLSCRWNIANLILNGTWSHLNVSCFTCQRDIEYSYLCAQYPGCTPIAHEVDELCLSTTIIEDTNLTCEIEWISEKTRGNSYFFCDLDCLELYPEESADCQSGCSLFTDYCGFMWNLLLLADSNKDMQMDFEECLMLVKTIPWNAWVEDEVAVWDGTDEITKCNYIDVNSDGIIDHREIFEVSTYIFNPDHENRYLQQTCSHCHYYELVALVNNSPTCTSPSIANEIPSHDPTESNSVCLSRWVDEKNCPESDYFVCDTVCDDSGDCSDCDSPSLCYILGLFFSSGDVTNDQKLSKIECTVVLDYLSKTDLSGNGYDTAWWSLSNREKCSDLDLNNDAFIHPAELIHISKHIMSLGDSSEATQQWEFEHRHIQVSCNQCSWYDTYNF